MDLAPLLLAGVRDAGSAQSSDKQFKQLLSHADDLIRASLQPTQQTNAASNLSQIPSQMRGSIGSGVGAAQSAVDCSAHSSCVVHVCLC